MYIPLERLDLTDLFKVRDALVILNRYAINDSEIIEQLSLTETEIAERG